MRRLGMALIIGALMVAFTGCYNYDPAHNARINRIISKDIRVISEDLNFYMGLDGPTILDRTEY
jgi:hypothetical protein